MMFTTMHQSSPRRSNDEEGGIHSLNSNVFSVNDNHMTEHVLEDENEDRQVKVEQQKLYLSNIRFSHIQKYVA